LLFIIQSIHPAAMDFRPEITLFGRWWRRAAKRADLEKENLSYRGRAYVEERFRHIWNRMRARIALAFGTQHAADTPISSLNTVLEELSIEHTQAMARYVPRPYAGDVLLFRARRQLAGLRADEYLGWKRTLVGNLEVCEVPGHQQNLMLEPHVGRLASELTPRLRWAQDRYAFHLGSVQVARRA
jgi:thioesterase domain-containing protein